MAEAVQNKLSATVPSTTSRPSAHHSTETDFGDLLSNTAKAAPPKPNIAQFMAATGASFEQAKDAIYVHKNWQHYLPNWSGDLDTGIAHRQLQDEIRSGTRSIEQKWSAPLLNGQRSLDVETIGATDSFRPLEGPMEGAVGGQIVPTFFDSPGSRLHGQLNAFQIVRPDGTPATTIMPHNRNYGSTDPSTPFGKPVDPSVTKAEFAADVYAFGLGQDALDNFARQFGAADWSSLNWLDVNNQKSISR